MKKALVLAVAAMMAISTGAAYAGGGGGGNGGQQVADPNSAPPGFYAGNPRYTTGGWFKLGETTVAPTGQADGHNSVAQNPNQHQNAG